MSNKKYSTIIITSEKTSFILPTFFHLVEKYWSENFFYISGDGDDNFNFKNSKYIKRDSSDIKKWTTDIKKQIDKIDSEYIIFGLDDFLIIDKFNEVTLDIFIKEMDLDNSIVRCSLGADFSCMKNFIYKKINDTDLISVPSNISYRCSTQFSIWRKDFLSQILSKNRSPWEFEMEVSSELSGNNSIKMLGTLNNFCLRWIEESANSSSLGKNNLNVLGLSLKDINEIIDAGLLSKDRLQFGYDKYWNDSNAIKFIDKKDFTLKDLKNKCHESVYQVLEKKYGFNYLK